MGDFSDITMKFSFISIFPKTFESYLGESMIARAISRTLIQVTVVNPRDFTKDVHHTVDGRPYGGGPGMVLMVEPILKAVGKAVGKTATKHVKVILTAPGGKQFTQADARRFAHKYKQLVFICGRYEGIDARVKKILKAEEFSVGPYVLTGGELPAMTMADAVARHIPGVLGKAASLEENRTASPEIYTRPEIYTYKAKKYRVPKVLLSGNHEDIENWRKEKLTK